MSPSPSPSPGTASEPEAKDVWDPRMDPTALKMPGERKIGEASEVEREDACEAVPVGRNTMR